MHTNESRATGRQLLLLLLPLSFFFLAGERTASSTPPIADFAVGPSQAEQSQRQWAKHLQLPVEHVNSIGMRLTLIPPGRFQMGSPKEEEWHRPDEVLHQVTVSRPFFIGTTEVNQKQYREVMGKNPSFFEGDDLPVETVTWTQAQEFCRKLSLRESKQYALPTEAQWEYACRAGTATPFFTGPTITPRQANYDGNKTYAGGPRGVFRETTVSVGSLPGNAWGVHEMHGNVWEWCRDWYAAYPQRAVVDPAGPAKGDRKVFRGGCWINFPAVCRSANRAKAKKESWNFHLGFRVVREIPAHAGRTP